MRNHDLEVDRSARKSAPTLLVTAGPSREHLDDVRFISNASSGRMGIEVARAAHAAGWRVELALGPVTLSPPVGVRCHSFVSADELEAITRELWPEVDAFVATAAVCDHRPQERVGGKRKKSGGEWSLVLVRTPDVLARRSQEKGDRVMVGFALEAERDLEEARRKLVQKRLDLIILNTVENLGAARGNFDWIEADGVTRKLGKIDKAELAGQIVEFLRQGLDR